ncbi:hypothetical protein SEPCBS119000_004104 [Sporothrix epigloea]|uniref:PXA domain-containing protein n=1 Tax=Sporothrix epigloea TaxID=1892477 RepID=A0ABP0DS37_9PEZI
MNDSKTTIEETDQAVFQDAPLLTTDANSGSSKLPQPAASPVSTVSSLQLPLSQGTPIAAGQQPSAPSSSAACEPRNHASNGDIPTRVIRFLATATPRSLGAVGVGLAATTYFVLGRVGLILIGAFGGIALVTAWEARNPGIALAIRGETSSELLARAIEYRKRDNIKNDTQRDDGASPRLDVFDEDPTPASAFENFRPQTRQALDDLVDAVIRDYVQWWYWPIVPSDQSFPLACRRALTFFLNSVSNHLSRKRPADAFLDFLTNSSSIVIVLFSELATAFAEHAAQAPQQQQPQPQAQGSDANTTISAADAIYSYLASNPDSSLANLLSQHQQATKFRMVADDLLSFFDRECYDCGPARNFLREITATSLLESTLQTCSKPEWINAWIVYLLEAGEPDFSQAIDVGMQTRTDTALASSNSNSNGNGNGIASGATGSAHMHHASIDIDGNVGNISLPKSRRTPSESEKGDRSRRKESVAHKKQLSRADEEMEEAIEEMKRMNQMIADEDARRTSKEIKSGTETEEPLVGATQRHAEGENDVTAGDRKILYEDAPCAPSTTLDQTIPKAPSSLSGNEQMVPVANAESTPITLRSSTQDPRNQQSVVSEPPPSSAASRVEAVPTTEPLSQFTNFDQLVPPARGDDDSSDNEGAKKAPALLPLTLHNATITIHDEPVADKGRIRGRPSWDFLIQIEPANSHYPGWMIVRKYADFEKLHEVLRRIANISGATAFTEQHGTLPSWKLHTRGSLRGELERYVRDACWFQSLAESEGMKRFLEKDTNNMPASAKTGLQAFEAMGKNMLDVLSNAPKGVAESSKVVVGGMTGVFGNLGNLGTNIGLGGSSHKKHASSNSVASAVPSLNGTVPSTTTGTTTSLTTSPPPASALQDVTAYTNRLSVSTPPRMDSGFFGASSRRSRDSMDSQQSSVVASQSSRNLPLPERRMSYQFQSGLASLPSGEGEDSDGRGRTDNAWDYAPAGSSNRGSQHNSRASSSAGFPRSPSSISLSGTRLPLSAISSDSVDGIGCGSGPLPIVSHLRSESYGPAGTGAATKALPRPSYRVATSGTTLAKQFSPLTESETRVAVELLFAVINELYTLSSAWNIRRTLLTAAKSFLLRPGNPSLVSIQSLLQKSVLDDNTTDAGMAGYLRKLRENSLPTDIERAAWPSEMTAEEKERLRVKARSLLIRSGVPVALMGVMGQSATSDALGRVFDCLQIEEVARGLMFGLMLQAARIVTH